MEAQDLPTMYDREDVEFIARPAGAQDIDLSVLEVEIQTVDGSTVLKTLTVGDGITVTGEPAILVKFPNDLTDDDGKRLLGPGTWQYEVRDPTLTLRKVVGAGHFTIRTRA